VRAALLQTFEFYLDDDRYSVPTLKLVVADDEARALAVAQTLLDESGHHRGVEVCVAGERVTGLGSFASRRLPEFARPSLTLEG
jgi:hypothetical protein